MNLFIPLLFQEIETRNNIKSFPNLKFDHHQRAKLKLTQFWYNARFDYSQVPIPFAIKETSESGNLSQTHVHFAGKSWTTLKLCLCVISPRSQSWSFFLGSRRPAKYCENHPSMVFCQITDFLCNLIVVQPLLFPDYMYRYTKRRRRWNLLTTIKTERIT